MATKREILMREIVARSVADNWEQARLEWDLADVFIEEEPDTCLCTHYPIKEICVLFNRLNRCETIVGNVCVNEFLGLPSVKIFSAVRRVAADSSKALNAEALSHARFKGWVNDWEYGFYSNTLRKRSLSGRQLAKRLEINRKVVGYVNRKKEGEL